MKKAILGLASSLILLTGCVGGLGYLQYPDEYNDNGRKVSATLKHTNWFGFSPLRGTDKVLDQLAGKCDGGKVTGISVEMYVTTSFLFTKTEITATGVCSDGEGSGSSSDEGDDSKSKSKSKRRRRRR